MARTTTIRFGRGKMTHTNRTVNRAFDATSVDSWTVELNDGTKFEMWEAFDGEAYKLDGRHCGKETFEQALRNEQIDFDQVIKQLLRKEHRLSQDPMGCLSDYE